MREPGYLVLDAEPASDLAHSPGREESFFSGKHKVDDYIVEKASEGIIEFTSIATGPLFEWGMHCETNFRHTELTSRQDSTTTSSSDSIFRPRVQTSTTEERKL